jgi:hypothetical protein
MAVSRLSSSILFVVVAILFCGGLLLLANARFQSGDSYPAYSSYSREARGTRALFEALDSLDSMDVSRNLLPLAPGARPSHGAFFMVGVSKDFFSFMESERLKFLEESVKGGDRLVITFALQEAPDEAAKRSDQKGGKNPDSVTEDESAGDGTKTESPGKTSADGQGRTDTGASSVWAVGFDTVLKNGGPAIVEHQEADLPAYMEWHGSSTFAPANSGWRTIYRKNGKPVVVERYLGKGTIVLVSDSFFLTNEAMKGTRSSLFLVWLTGGHHRVVFDETHLGVAEQTTIMTLIKRNGLIPFLISLLVIGILVAWKQVVPLLPVRGETAGETVEVTDNRPSAMAGLFRRNIRDDRILTVCVDEWEKAFAGGKSDHAALLHEARQVAAEEDARPRRQKNVRAAHNRIAVILNGRPKKSEVGKSI